MAKLHLPTPYSPGSLDPERVPNGATPRASYLRRAADGMNSIATYHKKLLIARCQNMAVLESGGAPVISPWPFYFRTGENTIGVRAFLGLVDTDFGAATNPTVIAKIYLAGTPTVVVQQTISYNGRNAPTGAHETLNRTHLATVDLVGLDPETEYYTKFLCNDGARFLFLMAHEIAELHADDSVAGVVDPSKFATDGPIYDEHVEDLLDAGDRHWRHGGCHYVSWAPEYGGAVSLTATTYTNLIDESSTSYSAATPGVTLAASYHGTATTPAAGPGVKIAVKAVRISGSGTLSVRLFDGTNAIELTGIDVGGDGDWYTGLSNIPQATSKWDIQGKVSSGEFDITSVCVFAFEGSAQYGAGQ